MLAFYRAQNTQLWLTLTSNETLGVLDGGYLEDYYGVDGQITIKNLDTGERLVIMMNEIGSEEPHEVFRGFIPTSFVTDGHYQLEGRVRDIIGNYTILSEVANPIGSERVIPIEFVVYEGQPFYITLPGILSLRMGFSVSSAVVRNASVNINTTPASMVTVVMPEVFKSQVDLASNYVTHTNMKREV